MAQNQKQSQQHKDFASWKPGSEAKDANNVGGEGDFGAAAGAGPNVERDYVSENTKRSDRGATQPMDWEDDGVRDHGAGVPNSGPGSGSVGDLDPDFVGIAGGSGVAASGPSTPPGSADDAGAMTSHPAAGHNQTNVGKVGGDKRVRGTIVTGDEDQSVNAGEGADDVTNAQARGDDSFASEISSGEARGEDNSPSDGTDDLG